jgi:thiol-disulfide isomerase/thioredoxin
MAKASSSPILQTIRSMVEDQRVKELCDRGPGQDPPPGQAKASSPQKPVAPDTGRAAAGTADRAAPTKPENAPRGKIAGSMTVAVTNEPVSGARVTILRVGQDGGYQSVDGTTDVKGRYSIEVPIGNVRLGTLTLPPGYWTDRAIENAVTSAAKPVFVKDYSVRRGPIWRVRVQDAKHHRPVPSMMCIVTRVETNNVTSSLAETDAEGIARITPPGFRGEFQLATIDRNDPLKWVETKPSKLTIEAGFRVDKVAEIEPDAKGGVFQIKDKEGKSATVRAARVSLDHGSVLLDIGVEPRAATVVGDVIGTVVDEKGQAIAGAKVAIARQMADGTGWADQFGATSGPDGRFSIKDVWTRTSAEAGERLSVVVVKDSFGGIDSKPLKRPRDLKTSIDFGRITMSRGKSIRVRVLDLEGKPAVGAWVEPTDNYAVRNQVTMTDDHGECVIRNLPQGRIGLTAIYGSRYSRAVAVVGDSATTVTLRLRPIPPAPQAATKPDEHRPIAIGQRAPALNVARWTDGKTRSLDDFKGKVVALDFWGIWCESCVATLPAMKNLMTKYKDRDVVFLSVHTAGTDIEQVRVFQRQQKWEPLSGLDLGDDVIEGATAKTYGVRGYPTLLIIGRDGCVAWSTDQNRQNGMKLMERAARALSIPWPIDEKAPEKDLIDKVCRIQEFLFTEAIDQALAKR